MRSKYKYSQFNSLVELNEDQKVIYNSLSHAIIAPDSLPADCNDLSQKQLQKLQINNFVVPYDIQEGELVLNGLKDRLTADSTFYLMVNPTLECNCRCWYCVESHPRSSISPEVVDQLKVTILSILSRYDRLSLSFFGGEPFLRFHEFVKPFMEWTTQVCRERDKELSFIFTTNGLLLTQQIVDFLKEFPNQSYQITLDGGREFHNRTRLFRNQEKDSYDKVLEAIDMLATAHLPVTVRLNLTHENINSAYEIVDTLRDWPMEKKISLQVACQQVWQDCAKGSLLEDFFNIRSAFAEIGIRPDVKEMDWFEISCYGDRLHTIGINYDGSMYKCSAIDYATEDSIGQLTDNLFNDLEQDFLKYWKRKTANDKCKHCRILNLCMKGCYKHVKKNPEDHCNYPTDEQKDLLIKQHLNELAFREILKTNNTIYPS